MFHDYDLLLPRNAFSARDAARAGDVWRAFQDAATLSSTDFGWPPERYRAEQIAFVVRQQTTAHQGEARYGDTVRARTCLKEFRRGLLVTRELWLEGPGGPIARSTQEWAHVRITTEGMRPFRAPPELIDDFSVHPEIQSVDLPAFDAIEGARERVFGFRCWFTWMDPLDHANHPAYVDWCDEAISIAMAEAGLSPVVLQPVAERVKWRLGVQAPAEVTVRTRVAGVTAAGDVVCHHRIEVCSDVAALAWTVRRLAGGGCEALLHALR